MQNHVFAVLLNRTAALTAGVNVQGSLSAEFSPSDLSPEERATLVAVQSLSENQARGIFGTTHFQGSPVFYAECANLPVWEGKIGAGGQIPDPGGLLKAFLAVERAKGEAVRLEKEKDAIEYEKRVREILARPVEEVTPEELRKYPDEPRFEELRRRASAAKDAREKEEKNRKARNAARRAQILAAVVANVGNDSQQERQREHAVPELEQEKLLRNVAFLTLAEEPAFRRFKRSDFSLCEQGCSPKFDVADVRRYPEDIWEKIKIFRERARNIPKTLAPILDECEDRAECLAGIRVRRHRARCERCGVKMIRYSVLVTVSFALEEEIWNLSREYNLEPFPRIRGVKRGTLP